MFIGLAFRDDGLDDGGGEDGSWNLSLSEARSSSLVRACPSFLWHAQN